MDSHGNNGGRVKSSIFSLLENEEVLNITTHMLPILLKLWNDNNLLILPQLQRLFLPIDIPDSMVEFHDIFLFLAWQLVFESLVQSRSFASSTLDQDQDQSSQFQNQQKTKPDLCGLVFCGLLWLQDQSELVHSSGK